MAGLLDFFTNPQTQGMLGMASGLLEASGPSRLPVGLGQGISRGFLQGSQMAQNAAHNQLAQTYLGEQINQLKTSNARTSALTPLLNQFAARLAGGGQGAPAAPQAGAMVPGHPGSSVMAGGPVGAPEQPAAHSGGLPFSLEDITLLKVLGGPDLTSAYNASMPNVEVRDGVMFDKKGGRVLGTMPTMNDQGFSTQLVPDGRGGWRVSQTPGGMEAYSAQQNAAEEAKARRDPFMGVMDRSGRPIPMTREGFFTQFGGGQQPQQQAPSAPTQQAPQAPPAPQRGMGPTPAESAAAEVAAREQSTKNVGQHEAAESAIENIQKLDMVIKELNEGDAITGMGAEVLLNFERAKQVVMNDMQRGKKISDTELLDALLGSDVFPMIKALGIGARGLDTPAEREFLRNVMTGTTPMNKETLKRMTKMRRDISARAVEKWNKRVGAGELDDYFEATKRQKRTLEIPSSQSSTPGFTVSPETQRLLDKYAPR